MSKMFAFNSIALAGLAGLAVLSAAQSAPEKDYEYCLHEFSSSIRECGFDTMEQCVAMISGRGGSCVRDPYLAETRGSNASKSHDRPRRRRTD